MFDLAVSVILAALPAAALLAWFYRQDRSRPEPVGLLGRSVLYGFLATLPAAGLEILLLRFGPRQPRLLATAFDAFIVAGLVEEGVKFFFVKRYLFRLPQFDQRMDGIMYAACVSLGFAFAENVLYGYNDSVVLFFRAFTAVPMHAAVAGIMGYWIGRAKVEGTELGVSGTELGRGSAAPRPPSAYRGLWEAVLLHGAYDFFLFSRSAWSLLAVPVLIGAGVRLLFLVSDARRRDLSGGA